MSKQTLTQWFPADVKPVHVGVYEVLRKYLFGSYPNQTYAYFNGEDWQHTKESSIGMHVGGHLEMSSKDGDQWRGLAVKP